jgi:branched-chain amino acid transport system permease protein
MVGLDRVAHVPAKHLSPGQRRQLEIIRLLAMEPSVILLDEPAAGLSGVEIQELERLIRAMAAAGATVILIEHHLNLVLAVSDDVTVLDAGRVIFEGPAVDAPKDPAVIAAYIGADAAAEVACEPTPEAATRSRTEVAQ